MDLWVRDGHLMAPGPLQVGLALHGFAKGIASVAILAYAVGCWVLNAVILRLARRAIKRKESTTLSTASAFLHGECA